MSEEEQRAAEYRASITRRRAARVHLARTLAGSASARRELEAKWDALHKAILEMHDVEENDADQL